VPIAAPLSIIKGVPSVLLVRHGQASFGAEDYDVLSPAGVRQSELLAAALKRRGVVPARLVSGTLRRQRETAAAFAEYGEVELDGRWDEYDANEVLTHHAETAMRLDGPGGLGDGKVDNRAFHGMLEPALAACVEAGDGSPSAPSWPVFTAAGAAGLESLGAELGRGETALVFTSGGVIAAICAALLGSPEAFLPINRVLVNASVTKLGLGSAGTNLISVNEHSHLEEVDRALITYR
jgi:broad specificity phosphatase PhoE